MKKPFIKTNATGYLTLAFMVLAALFATWTFTGMWPGTANPYNSYVIQAQSWLSGRLDLPENYQHLEIAIFEGKYYISFPPFPSYVMLPFVAMGWTGCDAWLSIISAVCGVIYAYKILDFYGVSQERSIMFAALATIGSNWMFTAQTPWVWFIAQNMAFTLSLMAIYYALKGKGGLSLAFWSCAVGCRPMQGLYIPVILYLLYNAYKVEDASLNLKIMIKKKWLCVIPMALIAISYMALNLARFGNPLEFGHNYLPEHTSSQYGQLHTIYIGDNLRTLFRMPKISFKGPWEYQQFNGTSIFLVSPVFIAYAVYTILAFLKNRGDKKLLLLTFGMIVLEIITLCSHVTMGGWHFGHRYINDVIPLVVLSLAVSLPQHSKHDTLVWALVICGLVINILGSMGIYA